MSAMNPHSTKSCRPFGNPRRKPKAIITMSQQVLYHLVRTNSLTPTKELLDFQEASVPKEKRKAPVLYISAFQRMHDDSREPMRCAEKTLRALVKDAP